MKYLNCSALIVATMEKKLIQLILMHLLDLIDVEQ